MRVDVHIGGVKYPAKLPEAVPTGAVLVHNNVRPARRQGTRGFRFWLALPDDSHLKICDCGWAPELGAHYASSDKHETTFGRLARGSEDKRRDR